MDKNDLLHMLDLHSNSTLYIQQMEMRVWGQRLIFDCRCGETQFKLHLRDCREMRWQVYTHQTSELAFPPTPLVSFLTGQSRHRKPCYMLTEHFGLTVLYGKLSACYEDREIALET